MSADDMNRLREQLDLAKHAYMGCRYSGDLAADVLDAGPARRRMLMRGGALGAALVGLAAVVALWVSAGPAGPGPAAPALAPAGAIAVAPPTTAATPMALTPATSFPAFPDGVSFAPRGTGEEMSGIGSMPAMPSMDLTFGSQTRDASTTRESV
jgi:hypothetical protein